MEKKKDKRIKNEEFYISKNDMMEELIRYNKTGEISDELGIMFLKIAKRYTSRKNFSGYSYREDMVSEAVYRMVSQIDKFDIDHPSANPFSYFTQVAHNQIISLLNKEKKHREMKSDLREKVWDEICNKENIEKIENKIEDPDSGQMDNYFEE